MAKRTSPSTPSDTVSTESIEAKTQDLEAQAVEDMAAEECSIAPALESEIPDYPISLNAKSLVRVECYGKDADLLFEGVSFPDVEAGVINLAIVGVPIAYANSAYPIKLMAPSFGVTFSMDVSLPEKNEAGIYKTRWLGRFEVQG